VADQHALAHLLGGRILISQGHPDKARSEIRLYLASGDEDDREVAIKWLAKYRSY
jgi:hypothetical protein